MSNANKKSREREREREKINVFFKFDVLVRYILVCTVSEVRA